MSKSNISKNSQTTNQTDWKRIDALRDEDIDVSEHPEMTAEMFAKAIARKGLQPLPRKHQLTLRLDADVLEWFKGLGKGYQTRINELLRAYMEAHRPK